VGDTAGVPRSNRPRRSRDSRGRADAPSAAGQELGDLDRILFGLPRAHVRDGREWSVRSVTGQGATKAYRCPGCDQEIPPGTPHVVVWPTDAVGFGGVEDRRHRHTPCWRGGRRPSRR